MNFLAKWDVARVFLSLYAWRTGIRGSSSSYPAYTGRMSIGHRRKSNQLQKKRGCHAQTLTGYDPADRIRPHVVDTLLFPIVICHFLLLHGQESSHGTPRFSGVYPSPQSRSELWHQLSSLRLKSRDLSACRHLRVAILAKCIASRTASKPKHLYDHNESRVQLCELNRLDECVNRHGLGSASSIEHIWRRRRVQKAISGKSSCIQIEFYEDAALTLAMNTLGRTW